MHHPHTITYDGMALLRMVAETPKESPLLSLLKKQADEWLLCERISVLDRKQRAPSGCPHDYTSMGPYWWRNPNTENGLPYIRRDGEVNPDTVEGAAYRRLSEAIHTLSLAELYLGDKRYGKKAVQMLYDWHISPETYMTPHLRYAQAIPGICSGRGIGIIDFATSYRLFDAVAILEFLSAIDEKTLVALKAWYKDLITWMLTSKEGNDEQNHPNNHGTWFDVQVSSAAIFFGDVDLAERTLSEAYERRVVAHVRIDGSQPCELERTKGINYSLYNLQALTLLGNMSKKLGVSKPYWQTDGERGDLIRSAVDYIAPYALSPKAFPFREIEPSGTAKRLAPLLLRAAHYYPEADYQRVAKKFLDDGMLFRLIPQA